ncbi:MAG: TetR/AcrR family transcriptional regulator [Sterolibacterium sp.]
MIAGAVDVSTSKKKKQPSASRPQRSRKGEREVERLLLAATTALARDGMAAATLGRIAAEADVDKAMVVYYFGSREVLLAQVVKRLGERAAAEAETALEQVSSRLSPGPVADVGVGALWGSILAVPELPRAYMTLLSGSRDVRVREALREMKAMFIAIFHRHMDALEAQGYRLLDDRDDFVTLLFAILRGLLLEWAESGETLHLRGAIEGFKVFAASRFHISTRRRMRVLK